ncbi:hypothetical protein N7539_005749 [Penicillium diatomitis]|uniref:Uncharacterized protein n=1 Tax=Penicillium diatomitis TaxID=2819901 RepID=A0A9X0BTS7_9EURO|nr:uncharacterized protein N7539_005749 [Penicillium diatomitis]KAJ5483953.1 hypothetical protein N7539_005749 [Penicillium diatomitis]
MSDRSNNNGHRDDSKPSVDQSNLNNPESSASPSSDRSKTVSSSTAFMPQSGKAAGIVGNTPRQQDHDKTEEDPDQRRREDVAGSERWIPMAGKPTKTSTL